MSDEQVESAFRTVLTPSTDVTSVVWQDADSEVILHAAGTQVRVLTHGLLVVGLSLETAETGPRMLTVPFATGTRQRLAGNVLTSERRPRGSPVLVDRWGDAALATAYGALLDIAAAAAASAGEDTYGDPLIAGGIYTQPNRLFVVPQARHLSDRPL